MFSFFVCFTRARSFSQTHTSFHIERISFHIKNEERDREILPCIFVHVHTNMKERKNGFVGCGEQQVAAHTQPDEVTFLV